VEKSTGIKTTGANEYVATFKASESAEGHDRVIQIVSIASGKIDESLGSPTRNISSNDSMDITTISGNITIGDNSYLAVYPRHSQSNGSCLITPLLCDNEGVVIGCLETKSSSVMLPAASGTNYIANCLSWAVIETGAWKLYPHVSNLSSSDTIDLWCYVF
jgi:hypothetical protein